MNEPLAHAIDTKVTCERREMKPYYEENGIQIFHSDCKELLDVRVDLLIADPPYGIGEAAGRNKSRGLLAISKDYGDDAWDDDPWSQSLISAVVSTSEHAVIWGGNYYAMPPSPSWLVWDKDNGATDFADCELAWTNWPTAVRRIRYRWQGMLQENMARKEVRVHPTQKPLAVIKWAISLAPNNPQSLFDPCIGSGTSLRAAKDLGMKAIGCDISEKWCEIAANRLRQEVLQFT